jgi:biotin carboxyl carrier protein
MRYSVKVGERVFDVEVTEVGETLFEITIGSKKVKLKVESLKSTAPEKVVEEVVGTEVKSDMSGTVMRLVVEEGENVEKGQPLLVLEAMKMENEITSPFTGTVAKINVSEGDKVESGSILMVISSEPAKVVKKAEKISKGQGSPVKVPMSGVVTRILKEAGENVQSGETILILEAMKMENPIDAPLTGTITQLTVKEGDNVNTDDVVAYIE